MKLLRNFIKIAVKHRCFPVCLLHIFRTPFPKNNYGGVLLNICSYFIISSESQIRQQTGILLEKIMMKNFGKIWNNEGTAIP